MLDMVIAVIGWIGAALILLSYVLLSLDRLPARSISYQAMNAVGAGAFIVNSGWNGATPSAVLNVIWMGIAIAAIARMLRDRTRRVASAAPSKDAAAEIHRG